MKKTFAILIAATIAAIAWAGQINYTPAQLDNTIRIQVEPSVLRTYLPTNAPYTTATLTANTWTKLLLATTVKYTNNWAIVDIGGSDYRYQYQGADPARFKVDMVTGVSSDTASTLVEVAMSKGTIGGSPDALEVGVYAPALQKNAVEVAPLSVSGAFDITNNQVIAVWIRADKAAAITFYATSIGIREE